MGGQGVPRLPGTRGSQPLLRLVHSIRALHGAEAQGYLSSHFLLCVEAHFPEVQVEGLPSLFPGLGMVLHMQVAF